MQCLEILTVFDHRSNGVEGVGSEGAGTLACTPRLLGGNQGAEGGCGLPDASATNTMPLAGQGAEVAGGRFPGPGRFRPTYLAGMSRGISAEARRRGVQQGVIVEESSCRNWSAKENKEPKANGRCRGGVEHDREH